MLSELFKKHNQWLNYIKSFGCNSHTAEDYVQEMYIKIHNHIEKNGNTLMFNNNEINFYFIYVILKNMYYDDLRKAKNKIKVELTDNYFEEETIETNDELYLKSVNKWLLRLENEINNIIDYNREKASLMYVKFVFQKIFVENVSVSELSREVGITYWSLRNTVLIIKDQIKNEIR